MKCVMEFLSRISPFCRSVLASQEIGLRFASRLGRTFSCDCGLVWMALCRRLDLIEMALSDLDGALYLNFKVKASR